MTMGCRLLHRSVVILVINLAAACGDGGTGPAPSPEPAVVQILPRPDSLRQGDTIQIAVVVQDARGTTLQGVPVTWTSRQPDVVSISAGGSIIAVGRGVSTLIAEAGAARDSIVVQSFASWAAVAIGNRHACALTLDGAVYCWGRGFDGELGNGASEVRLEPDSIHGGIRLVSLDPVSAACGTDADGRVICWRSNGPTLRLPTVAFATPAMSRVAVGTSVGCGVGVDGVAYCWGNSPFGQLGTGVVHTSPSEKEPPSPIAGGHRVRSVGVGNRHACAVTDADGGYCWGFSLNGEVGTASPVEIVPEPWAVS
jgi:alpha-tubulin suppressor-like RCC1 family protein